MQCNRPNTYNVDCSLSVTHSTHIHVLYACTLKQKLCANRSVELFKLIIITNIIISTIIIIAIIIARSVCNNEQSTHRCTYVWRVRWSKVQKARNWFANFVVQIQQTQAEKTRQSWCNLQYSCGLTAQTARPTVFTVPRLSLACRSFGQNGTKTFLKSALNDAVVNRRTGVGGGDKTTANKCCACYTVLLFVLSAPPITTRFTRGLL